MYSVQEIFPCAHELETLPHFCFYKFHVSGFMWMSLITLYLSFVQGDKNQSIYILLHADHQLNQHNFFKMLYFSTGTLQLSYRSLRDQRCVRSFLGPQIYSSSIPASSLSQCHAFFHYFSLVLLEVRDGDSPKNLFCCWEQFCCPGLFYYYKRT